MRSNGSVLGKLQTPSRTGASGVWPIRSHELYKRDGRWPFALPVTANLSLWIDASQPTSVILNGGSVLQILDLSSNQRLINQTTAARQPEYILSGRNGLNVMRFTAANTHWIDTVNYAVPASHTVFAAMSRTASGVNSIHIGAETSNRQPFLWGTLNIVSQRSNSTTAINFGSASTSTGWFYTTTRRDGTSSISIWRNATLLATVTTGTAVTDPVNGNWEAIARSGSAYTDGDIGEILVYESALSDSDVAAVESYLAAKWAI